MEWHFVSRAESKRWRVPKITIKWYLNGRKPGTHHSLSLTWNLLLYKANVPSRLSKLSHAVYWGMLGFKHFLHQKTFQLRIHRILLYNKKSQITRHCLIHSQSRSNDFCFNTSTNQDLRPCRRVPAKVLILFKIRVQSKEIKDFPQIVRHSMLVSLNLRMSFTLEKTWSSNLGRQQHPWTSRRKLTNLGSSSMKTLGSWSKTWSHHCSFGKLLIWHRRSSNIKPDSLKIIARKLTLSNFLISTRRDMLLLHTLTKILKSKVLTTLNAKIVRKRWEKSKK